MSTRGVIAVTHGDGWRGVYHGMDSYPTWLGPRLWRTLHCYPTLESFAANVIDAYPGGYRHLDNPYEREAELGDMRYTHADERETALMIEWVYVVGRHVLTIFTSAPTGEEQRITASDGHWWMEPVYRWDIVCQRPLDGPEPEWQAIADGTANNWPAPVASAIAHRI